MYISFVNLLNTSISASWLVLVVIGLRFLLKKAPKAIHCALWALVAIRLICPFSIESTFSLVPSTQTVSDYYLTQEGAMNTAPAVLDVVENPVYPENIDITLDTKSSRVSWLDVEWSVFIWPAGMATMALYALISWLRIRKKVSASISIASDIRLCDYIDSPFILGLVRPKIYLPSDMEQGTIDHVLAHERAHLARKDHWWKPLGFALLTVHWFNPLMCLAYILLCRDIELACDEKVIKNLDAAQKKSYSSALLQCSVSRPMIAACPLAFGEVGVKERVKTVLNYKKPGFWIILISIIACIIVALCFLTDPPSQEDSDVDSTLIADGVYVSQEKVYWAWYSSYYPETMTMEISNNTVTISDGKSWDEGPFPLENDWQEECPINETRRESLAELSNIEPIFAIADLSDCRYLVIDSDHFLVEKGGELYLVAWEQSNVHLEIIRYVFHMVPEAEYTTDSGWIKLGYATVETDLQNEAIYRYFLEQYAMDSTDNINFHTSVSFKRYGEIYSQQDDESRIQLILAAVRVGQYIQNSDGTFVEESSELLPVRLSMMRHDDGTYEVTDCVRDERDYSASAFTLEAECWRQAFVHFNPDTEMAISGLITEYPEYFTRDTTYGLDLLWWETPEGIRCVILSGLQRQRIGSEAGNHPPLTVPEAMVILQSYDIPIQALFAPSNSTLAIFHVEAP